MNIDKIKSILTLEQHLLFELFLCFVIALLLFNTQKNIVLDSNGFTKDTALVFGVEFNGNINVAARDGDKTTVTPEINPLKKGSGILLNSIGTAIIRNNNSTDKKLGFIDNIISPAMASMHNLPGHDYLNFPWTIGGVSGCYRYDITNYPSVPAKFVGACI